MGTDIEEGAKEDGGCCESFKDTCKTSVKLFWIRLWATVIMLVAIGLIGLNIFFFVEYPEMAYTIGFTAAIPFVLAGFLVMLTVLQFCSVRYHSKIALIAYIVLMVFVIAFVLAFGSALLGVVGVFGLDGNLILQLREYVNDFELATYEVCCFNEFNGTQAVQECAAPLVTEGCYEDKKILKKALGKLGNTLCTSLESIKFATTVNGTSVRVPIVGDPVTGSCGGGDPSVFVDSFDDSLSENIHGIGGGVFALGFILIVSSVFVVSLSCKKNKGDGGADADEATNEITYLKAEKKEKSPSPVKKLFSKKEKTISAVTATSEPTFAPSSEPATPAMRRMKSDSIPTLPSDEDYIPDFD
eukprot:CAMPEP_0204822804 /NCGR_PEP_ID=MMETSP1346-20131115/987_1 /ASSEMBLY_ACC=CAM_ASM_000771 /TAXON_ID=215587 /ORGANISM="Aplanochytrium stocchinoi, Strain GSBS06" /LENGTH=356 /DNA_ID=CAMNT_0051949211 /DNA_START=67 /DNA_END=1138 /DNA_ORIENTATION=+